MKIIKTFEAWSAKFNRTLQGAAALATSTNKPHQKKQSIEDYANRSIGKEEFAFRLVQTADGREDMSPNIGILLHDPKFILKPIEQLTLIPQIPNSASNTSISGLVLSIPLIYKSVKTPEGTIIDTNQLKIITFTEDGSVYLNNRNGFTAGQGLKIKFVDRASIENFMAMAIQAITSSPEPGTPVESAAEQIKNRYNKRPNSGMTKEKQDILDLIQKIVLDKDMRSFTI